MMTMMTMMTLLFIPVLIGLSAWAWTAIGVGGAAALTGGAFGAKAINKRRHARNLESEYAKGGLDAVAAYMIDKDLAKTDKQAAYLAETWEENFMAGRTTERSERMKRKTEKTAVTVEG